MNKREPRLSQTDYVNRYGGECPWCESTDIQRSDHAFNRNMAALDMYCSRCGESWTADYKLIGYMEVK